MLINSRNSFITSHKFWYYAIMIFFAVMYFTIAIANHYYYRTNAYDYGVYNFAFWDYSHFQLSPCPLYIGFYKYDVNFLQDHFSLTLMCFVPVYWLLNWLTGTYTISLIQVVSILIGGWATYRFIAQKAGDNWLGIGALLYYFLLLGHFTVFSGDTNIAVISAMFIPLFLYYFELKKYTVASIFFVLALFSRENIPIWFLFLLPLVLLWHRNERKVVIRCLIYMAVAGFYFVCLFKLIIPHLETANKQYGLFNYGALGESPYEALKFVMHHPYSTFRLLFVNQTGNHLFNGVKREFYLVYFISGGFMLFLRPKYFIWFIPLVAQKMFNDEPLRWSIEWHYAIEVVTMLPIAVFVIIAGLENRKLRYVLSSIVCILTLAITSYKLSAGHRAVNWYGSKKENIFGQNFFHSDLNVKEINEAITQIPFDASVSASGSILPHLAERQHIYEFPHIEDASYMALLTRNDYWAIHEAYRKDVIDYLLDSNWNIVSSSPSFVLLKKEPNKFVTSRFICNAEKLSSDSTHFITTNGNSLNNGETRNQEHAHSGKVSVRLDSINTYGFTWIPNDVSAGQIIVVSVWRYGGKKESLLVASDSKGFYKSTSTVVEKGQDGWERLMLSFMVPANSADLGVYVWNSGKSKVWFDDMQVTRISNPGNLTHFLLNY